MFRGVPGLPHYPSDFFHPLFPTMQATQRLLHTTAKQLPRSLSRFHTSYFHSSAAVMVKAGDSIPDIELTEGNPGNKVNLSKELGSGLIIGVPAAFSKLSCKL